MFKNTVLNRNYIFDTVYFIKVKNKKEDENNEEVKEEVYPDVERSDIYLIQTR